MHLQFINNSSSEKTTMEEIDNSKDICSLKLVTVNDFEFQSIE